MRFKNIHFILNPVAGSEEPILSHINKIFCNSGISWDISITKKSGDAFKIAKSLLGKTDLIAVYGGDGSLSEVAGALYNKNTPMAIVPGGTANVMAKELGIPLDTADALELLKGNKIKIIKMDIGFVNKSPFMLRINLGIMADMITQANRKLKDNLGQIAYGISAVQSLTNAKPINYKLLIDGKRINENGVSLTVTNSGSVGIGDFSLLPGISITDGLMDIILLKDSDVMSVLRVAGSTLLQTGSDVLKHWQCKRVTIVLDKAVAYLCDDIEKRAKRLIIKTIPKALSVVIPK